MGTVLVHRLLVLILSLPSILSLEDRDRLVDRSEDIIREQDAEEPGPREEAPIVSPDELQTKCELKLPFLLRRKSEFLCRSPLIPENGYLVGKDFHLGSTVHFRCQDGYFLVGQADMTCVQGPFTYRRIARWYPMAKRYCRKKDNSLSLSSGTYLPGIHLKPYFLYRTKLLSIKSYHTNHVTSHFYKCGLPMIKRYGSCRNNFPRFFFNPFKQKCEVFKYGVCYKNGSVFKTLKQCQLTCLLSLII